MIMNYVLSFCKITAASRIFSRNFYLPLLKPITPKDALRTFKITGKWLLGSKIQHYIPVLFNHKRKRSNRVKDYGKSGHKFNDSYTYMSPILDPENESHKNLLTILGAKNDEEMFFVYTIEDKMYNLVFPANLELAIQDGEIIDVLISQSNDKILIKLKDFKKVPVELEFCERKENLLRGEGATTIEEEQFHHHSKMIMALAKIFEAKELAEEWELEMIKIVARKKKQKGEGTVEWNEMINENLQNLDWDKFEDDAKKVIEQIWEPAEEQFIGMTVDDLEKTRNLSEFIKRQGDQLLNLLPSMSEISDAIKNMGTAIYEELIETYDDDASDDMKILRLSGVRLTLSSGKECFIIGQMVKTDEGDIFVPGRTIENEFGVSFAPGITILMDNQPTLIKGLIMGEEDQQKPMFLPTESSITAGGELTFCRNPEEYKKSKPQKIFVKRKEEDPNSLSNAILKKKKKKKKVVDEQTEANREENKTVNGFNSEDIVNNNFIKIGSNEMNGYHLSEEDNNSETCDDDNMNTIEILHLDDDIYRPTDDGMDKLIGHLEDKKSELQKMLDALRNLKITLDNCVTYVNVSDAAQLAAEITIDNDKMHKLAEIILTLTRRANTFRERHNVNIQNINNPSMIYDGCTFLTEGDEKFYASKPPLKIILKSAMYAANEVFKTRPKDQFLAMKTLTDVMKDSLIRSEEILEELCLLMNTNLDRNEVCTAILKSLTENFLESKLEILKDAIRLTNRNVESDLILEKLVQVLEKDDDIFCPAFRKLAKSNDVLIKLIMDACQKTLDHIKTEQGARDYLQNCICASIKTYINQFLLEFNRDATEIEIKEFLGEALELAKTLDLYNIEDTLNQLLLNPDNNLLSVDKTTSEFIKRFLLIRKLCERDYSMKTSLERIRKHPNSALKDPRIRQLLRESATLNTKARDLKSSLEVPLRLFQGQNFLAIEDCVNLITRLDEPLLISRKGIQAVVPKEAARNVLCGRVAYVLVDESGVTKFKPMHMFSALKLGKSLGARYQDFPLMGGREMNNGSFDDMKKSPEFIYKRQSPTKQSDVRLFGSVQ